jgi:phosphoglucosamine mutase
MKRTGEPLSKLKRLFTPLPQTQVNLPIQKRRELGELPGVMKAIKTAELRLGKDGRVLVRFSGTELKVRVLVEGIDRKVNEALAAGIVEELKKALG